MYEWLSTQPWWMGVSIAGGILLLGIIVGRVTKKTLTTGGVTRQLKRIADHMTTMK